MWCLVSNNDKHIQIWRGTPIHRYTFDRFPWQQRILFDEIQEKFLIFKRILEMDSLSSEEDNTVSSHSIQRKVILEFIHRIEKEVSFYTTNEKYSNRQDIDSRLQCQRIEKIFDTCIQYIKLASYLPTFLIESPDVITASIPTLRIASLNVNDISSKEEEFNSLLGRYLTIFGHRNHTNVSDIDNLQVNIQSDFKLSGQ